MTQTDRIKKMRDPKGFRELWQEKVREGLAYKQAYKELEKEYGRLIREAGLDEILDERRYSSYDSFRISTNRQVSTN